MLQPRESKFKMLSTHMKKFACWRLRSPAVAFVFDVAVTVLDRPVELACNRTNSWTNPLRSGYFAARTRVLESFEFRPEKNFPPDLPAQVLMQRMLPLRNSSVTTADVTEDWEKKKQDVASLCFLSLKLYRFLRKFNKQRPMKNRIGYQ